MVGYLNRDGSATVTGEGLPAEQAIAPAARVHALAERAKRPARFAGRPLHRHDHITRPVAAGA